MKRLFTLIILVAGLCGVMAASAAEPAVIELQAGQDLPEVTADKALVIDFNASWCMPCRMFKPAFDRAAAEFADKATFVSVNIDNFPEIAKSFNVRSIPYVVVMKEGKEPVFHLGAMSYDQFKAFLDAAL